MNSLFVEVLSWQSWKLWSLCFFLHWRWKTSPKEGYHLTAVCPNLGWEHNLASSSFIQTVWLNVLKQNKTKMVITWHNHWMWILNWFSFFFSFIFIRWRLITLQYYSGFCHTLKWISHGVTCIPHPDPPSHLPLHPIPLGLPSAPGPSTCFMHPTWAGDLFHPR